MQNTAALSAAQQVFGIPGLADMIFTHVRAHWKQTRHNHFTWRLNKSRVKCQMRLAFQLANLDATEGSYTEAELTKLIRPLRVLVSIRHHCYTAKDKLNDGGNEFFVHYPVVWPPRGSWWNPPTSSRRTGVDRFHCEAIFLHAARRSQELPYAIDYFALNMNLERVLRLCRQTDDGDDIGYYQHLFLLWGDGLGLATAQNQMRSDGKPTVWHILEALLTLSLHRAEPDPVPMI